MRYVRTTLHLRVYTNYYSRKTDDGVYGQSPTTMIMRP
jgi:hypothetical protein